MKKIKKIISLTLILFMVFGRVFTSVVIAEEIETLEEETPAAEEQQIPEEEPLQEEVVIENEALVEDEILTESSTGENEILENQEDPEEAGEEVVVEEADEADEENQINEDPQEDEVLPEEEEVVIETGDSISVVEAENKVNINEVNSQVLHHTLNIFFPQSGDINFSNLSFLKIVKELFDSSKADTVANVRILESGNYAFVENEIVSYANTGQNSIESDGQAVIKTGNAYSIVTLLNQVNTTIVNSKVYIVTINIFGEMEGNIILPEETSSKNTPCCGDSVEVKNNAEVTNEVSSEAKTGDNEIIASGDGDAIIQTGSAKSVVNVINMVNQNMINMLFYYIYINNFGSWTGNFLGVGGIDGYYDSQNLRFIFQGSMGSSEDNEGDCGDNCYDEVSIENSATVSNKVASMASTSSNKVVSSQGEIYTGDALSSVSLVNIVNTNIINSFGFIGFINIFGLLKGDIGGASLFASNEEGNDPQDFQAQEENKQENTEESVFVMESGGELWVSQYNNIGNYVLPGDTVTFFVTVKNKGSGKVYDTKLKLSLIDSEGNDLGGAIFDLGDIQNNKGVKLTTGLVLSKDATTGLYIARATVYGNVGPSGETISASADSNVLISGVSRFVNNLNVIQEAEATMPRGDSEVLGIIVSEAAAANTQTKMLMIFAGLLSIYLPAKGYQKRKRLLLFYRNARPLIEGAITPIKALQARITSLL